MERGTWIGIAVVSALGVVGALIAFLLMAPATSSMSAVDDVSDDAGAAGASAGPAAAAPSADPPDPRVNRPPETRPVARTRASDPSPPPPPIDRDDDPLEEGFRRAEELLAHPIGADLPPDASEAEVRDAVATRISDVEEIVQEYREIAREDPDPAVRGEALQRAAALYDRLAEQVPVAPPPYMDEAGMDAWVSRNEAMMRNLHERAEAMRQDAAVAAERE